MPQDTTTPFIYSICQLAQPIDLKNIRKLRGAVGRYMLQRDEDYYKRQLSLDNPWLYGHGKGSEREILPLISFRLDDTGHYPEICVRQEASEALLNFISTPPFQVLLGRKNYRVEVSEVYQYRCNSAPASRVYTYQLEDIVPFSKAQFSRYMNLRASLGYQPGSHYKAVDEQELIDFICTFTKQHIARAVKQQWQSNQPIQNEKVNLPSEDSIFHTGSLLHIDQPKELTHSTFYGSGNIRFSAFSGLQLRTNLKLAHHWGIGLERVHGAGRLMLIKP